MREQSRRWLGLDLFAVLVMAFVVLPWLGTGVVAAVRALRLGVNPSKITEDLVGLVFQETGLFGLTVGSVWLGYHRPLNELGFGRSHFWREVGVGVVALGPLILLQEGGAFISRWLFRLFLPARQVAALLRAENVPVEQMLRQASLTEHVVFIVVLVALAPLAEELFFRGFAQAIFRERTGVVWAVTFSSLLFAVIHLYLVQFLPVLLMGAALALLAEWRGSLTAGITAHALLNIAALLKIPGL